MRTKTKKGPNPDTRLVVLVAAKLKESGKNKPLDIYVDRNHKKMKF